MKINWILIVFSSLSFSFAGELEQVKNNEFNIYDYKWLEGHWVGEGFGAETDSYWMYAADSTMMGMYRNYKDGKIVFYQFFILDKTGLKIKHYNANLEGWEEKDKYKLFKLIDYDSKKLIFEGLTYQYMSKKSIEITLNFQRETELETHVFIKTRK